MLNRDAILLRTTYNLVIHSVHCRILSSYFDSFKKYSIYEKNQDAIFQPWNRLKDRMVAFRWYFGNAFHKRRVISSFWTNNFPIFLFVPIIFCFRKKICTQNFFFNSVHIKTEWYLLDKIFSVLMEIESVRLFDSMNISYSEDLRNNWFLMNIWTQRLQFFNLKTGI